MPMHKKKLISYIWTNAKFKISFRSYTVIACKSVQGALLKPNALNKKKSIKLNMIICNHMTKQLGNKNNPSSNFN